VKPPPVGLGNYVRYRQEILIFGVKGTIRVPDTKNRPDSIIEAQRRGHSKKSVEAYELIEKAFPNRRYLELFAQIHGKAGLLGEMRCN